MPTEYLGNELSLFQGAALHCLDPLEPGASNLRPGGKQRFKGGREIGAASVVFKSVACMFQHGSAPAIDYLEWR